MRPRVFLLFPIVLFFLMLCFPKLVFSGARDGLLLWFSTVLPTLFPFLVLSEVLLRTHTARLAGRLFSPVLSPLLKISAPASFAVIGGMLCGYPVGARITCSLVKDGQISVEEGTCLLDFVNQLSPAFFIGYVITQNLKDRRLLLPGFFFLYVVPMVTAAGFRRIRTRSREKGHTPLPAVETLSAPASFASVLDESISFASGALVHIGGYMMIFSILLAFARRIALDNLLWECLFLPSLEVSSGVHLLSSLPNLTPRLRCTFLMFCCSFGGWCALFQTKYMLEGSPLSLRYYALKKLATASVTSLLMYVYYSVFLL